MRDKAEDEEIVRELVSLLDSIDAHREELELDASETDGKELMIRTALNTVGKKLLEICEWLNIDTYRSWKSCLGL